MGIVRILLIISFFLFSCNTKKKTYQERLTQDIFIALAFSSLAYVPGKCASENDLFFTSEYGLKFKANLNQYNTVIIGNSTMDISSRYTRWLESNWQSVAVSGNTLCNMKEQLGVINTVNPSNIVIGSLGGNDVLRKLDAVKNGTNLIQVVRERFPSSKVTGIGIHPTRVDYANENRGNVNSQLSSIVDCYINPDIYFTIEPDGKASNSNMLDSIHYNETVSFEIKNSITGCLK